jgi:3',5'-cyclic AMP phosphodiesterase CpdA
MTTTLRLALTADLHWGLSAAGDQATRELVAALRADPPDLLILAGDLGTRDHFAECLALFRNLPGQKALVPGNHDLWVEAQDPRGDSLALYERHLPALAREHGFHYLDEAPLLFPEAGLAVVGSINWYDYSWSLPQLQAALPDWEERLAAKRFTRGQHNDANFIRWDLDDRRFTARVVARVADHLRTALAAGVRVIVVTHHPPFYGLNYPRREPPTPDGLLWDAFSGNRALEELLAAHADRIALAFCGHTHRAREGQLGTIRGYNIGGDYHFKRLLRLAWPAGVVTAEEFH